MAAAAAQQQPQNAKNPQTNDVKVGSGKREQVKKTLPQSLGIVIMAVLLVASLFVGNMRALQKVTPPSFLRQGAVSSIVEDRAVAAVNAENVAKRASMDDSLYTAVESALSEVRGARTARALSRADQKLTAAVSEMTAEAQASLTSEDRRVLSIAADDFTEQGNFLRQEARKYNEKAGKAVELYEKLPTSFILSEPDYYEGL